MVLILATPPPSVRPSPGILRTVRITARLASLRKSAKNKKQRIGQLYYCEEIINSPKSLAKLGQPRLEYWQAGSITHHR